MTSSSDSPRGPGAWDVLAQLWSLMNSILDESAPALEAIGLTPKAFFLLAAVDDHPFPAELARIMHLPPPTVTYLVKQMEAKGFLKRKAEPGDLRKFRLIVTAGGRKAIRLGREAIGKDIDRRLSLVGAEEVGPFVRVLERLARPGTA